MHDYPEARLELTLTRDALRILSLLLQNAFSLRISRPCPPLTFLPEGMGLERGFIEERIQTIFLDASPVDDLASATVADGSSLALSAAMPGLVGTGILAAGPDMAEFLGRQEASFWDGCAQILLNWSPLDQEGLLRKGTLSEHETVLVRAKTAPGTTSARA